MKNFYMNFGKGEDGAVTVDWVVLIAAIAALGLAVVSTMVGDDPTPPSAIEQSN